MADLEKAYYDALGVRESSDNYQAQNQLNYLGRYQMGEGALVDTGYVYDDGLYNNDFSGGWTGKDGVNSISDFLNNATAQDQAVREYSQQNWITAKSVGLSEYLGETVGGIRSCLCL